MMRPEAERAAKRIRREPVDDENKNSHTNHDSEALGVEGHVKHEPPGVGEKGPLRRDIYLDTVSDFF